MSVEQARIITESYRTHTDEPRILQRAYALADSLQKMPIRVDRDELIVGNRTPGIRAGVVFPEAGISWVDDELDTLADRPQDPFLVRSEDAEYFRKELLPFWSGKTLEDVINQRHGDEIRAVKKVVKINQTDHAQGHINPNVALWLQEGPAGLRRRAEEYLRKIEHNPDHPAVRAAISGAGTRADYYRATIVVLEAAAEFIRRYAVEARRIGTDPSVAAACDALSNRPPETFQEALQAVWFLFVILQMESNASSFSPGRLDQYLLPYYRRDIETGSLDAEGAQELIDALWIKFNQIVYLRSASSAQYFAGFPIGFNVAIGGVGRDGRDATNELSFHFLTAQEHLGLPQPNLSARLSRHSSDEFVDVCARVIGRGSGMPQIVNDESIIPSLQRQGITEGDARDYCVVGCVELSTQGNNLGWSDAAMFNLVKALELALNDGVCMLTGHRLGPATGTLADHKTVEELESAYLTQLDYFFIRMIPLCDTVDRRHAEFLPSPFLSSVIDSCLENGLDVTAGGARYNLSGIQAIQVANVADSLAALKTLVYGDNPVVDRRDLLDALRNDFVGKEDLRQLLINRAPKYGNDTEWVDAIGNRWATWFAERLRDFTNARGGPYHMGLYTVSAHVPMGMNVGATPDGRKAREPLADGGMSAMYGRDTKGPTALLQSVARVQSIHASNGTLLNMKFLPSTFQNREEREKFNALLRAFVTLGIHHVQFNVVQRDTLIAARKHPEQYRNLTIRVAGYTAYFVELAPDLQEEIIARTAHEM